MQDGGLLPPFRGRCVLCGGGKLPPYGSIATLGRRYKKYPPPERSGVGYSNCSIPRFHPGCSEKTEPLIDALTGAPGRLFPTCGSEVVSFGAGKQKPFTMWLPLWESYRERVSSSQLFTTKNLAHFFWKVNPFGRERRCRRPKVWVENRARIVHNAEVTKNVIKLHNSTPYVNSCNLSTPDIVEIRRLATNILRMS